MKIFEETLKDIERDLVVKLTLEVRCKRISFDDSRKIAKDFIELFPFANHDDLFNKLSNLSNKHRIVRKVYVKHAPNYFDEKSEYVLYNMRRFINFKNIDKAINLAKGINYAKT